MRIRLQNLVYDGGESIMVYPSVNEAKRTMRGVKGMVVDDRAQFNAAIKTHYDKDAHGLPQYPTDAHITTEKLAWGLSPYNDDKRVRQRREEREFKRKMQAVKDDKFRHLFAKPIIRYKGRKQS